MSAIPRPGNGWSRFDRVPVFEHAPTGLRVHLHGTVRYPDGSCADADRWPECQRLWWHIRVAGGNRKRGLMTRALEMNKERKP